MTLREIDKLVATEIFGWKKAHRPVESKTTVSAMIKSLLDEDQGYWWLLPDGTGRDDIPHYSSDIAAAWDVVTKLRNEFDVEIEVLSESHRCELKGADPNNRFFIYAPTAPLAICLAALKSKGIEI
jgi:hypothetical protein